MTKRPTTERAEALDSTKWLSATLKRIKAQEIIVDQLEPGSKAHRLAVQLLLLYRDSLHVLSETSVALAELRRLGTKKNRPDDA